MKKETILTTLFLAELWLFSTSIGFAQRSVTSREYAQVYGFPPDLSQTGALMLNPHHPFFDQLPAESIKAPHGHFQHFAPARPDDDFPYEDLQKLEAWQIARGDPPIFVTATYDGKRRPVYFSWNLNLDPNGRPTADPSWWSRAVNLRDEAFIQFFANEYVRKRMFQPSLPNYWLAVDNCAFWIESYGVLDDTNVFHSVSQFDTPFAQNDKDFLDSVIYFLSRLKQIAPDIHIMGNEGTMSDETRFSEVWAGFDGTMREDITEHFEPSSSHRDNLYLSYKRYQWESLAGKVALLAAWVPNDFTFQDKLRTAYIAYLIFRGPNFFFAPRFIDPPNGVPISAYSEMQRALGEPTGGASDQLFDTNEHPGYRLYSRLTAHGMVYLNWSGNTVTIPLPNDKAYFNRDGKLVTNLTIPDLRGDYVLSK